MNGQSVNITEQKLKQLQQIIPECFTEGKLDWEKLKVIYGDNEIEFKNERYHLNWAGKSNAYRLLQTPTYKTLKPGREESVNFDETENVFIEGDNLEVLKTLQKAYFGKIKMIYIDPPYNTGNDFIYKDDFSETLTEYRQKVGDVDEQGNANKSALFKNTKENGQYHSNWLNMMLPRLFLARNLLRDDGVIFVSIDDNEVHNLRLLMDEIFGEENFVGMFSWLKKRKGSFLTKKLVSITEYCLVYSKSVNVYLQGEKLSGKESQPLIKRTNNKKVLEFPANYVFTKLKDGIYKRGIYGKGTSAVELLNDIEVKEGKIINGFSLYGPFIWSQEFLDSQISTGAKLIINTNNFQVRVFKIYEENDFKGVLSFIDGKIFRATNEDGYEELKEIFMIENVIEYPKPKNLIKFFITISTNNDDLILDFFAGSGTTAHAVMELNKEDGGNRKWILVQLPETTDPESEAYKDGYKTIADIAKERIRRAAQNIRQEIEQEQKKKAGEIQFEPQNSPSQKGQGVVDLGFKVFKLDESNFKQWRPFVPENAEQIKQTVMQFVENVKPEATTENILYELMLKNGKPLTTPLKKFPSIGGVSAESGRGGRNTQNYMNLPFNPNLKERARELRKAGILAEVLLWNKLKNGQFKGFDFDRQKIIGNYIVDFYCTNCNVVIEIDGSSHDNKVEYDAERDRYLESLGLKVIHIKDEDVKKNLDDVMEMLYHHPALTTPNSSKGVTTPNPSKGGEFWVVGDNELALLLESVDKTIIDQVLALKPQKVLALDKLFNGNDQLKTNTVLQFRDAGIEFKSV